MINLHESQHICEDSGLWTGPQAGLGWAGLGTSKNFVNALFALIS